MAPRYKISSLLFFEGVFHRKEKNIFYCFKGKQGGNSCPCEYILTFILYKVRPCEVKLGAVLLGELKQTSSIIHEIPWVKKK